MYTTLFNRNRNRNRNPFSFNKRRLIVSTYIELDRNKELEE